MHSWLARALDEKDVEALQGSDGVDGVYCLAWEHEWYSDGVVMDWAALHRGLSTGTRLFSPSTLVADVMRFGCDLQNSSTLVTSIDLRAPWRFIELSEQAQRLSAFLLTKNTEGHGNGVQSVNGDTPFYRFIRGPPGQRSVRDDLCAVLQDVSRQLTEGGVMNHIFFSSVAVKSDNFEQLISDTAAVYRALKGAGFEIYGNGSSFEPRRVFTDSSTCCWNTLSLGSLQREELLGAFLVDLFCRWLDDCYVWLCETPPRSLVLSSGCEDKKMHFFLDFYTRVVHPRLDAIDLVGAKEMSVEDVSRVVRPLLVKKTVCVGPQKWSTLELRLCLCALNAYDNLPRDL